ncbi:hypothetical protein CQW23_09843 [Capsicum baccatum]|uniref:Uncharacterized protein n=1 Tax=Capsicum baccatum TaxID=33114 RepID=A0A2G2WXV8_CAPBA|nr:hypothetical protein CQW23_09843 [Capsicum baccatum]
MGCKVGILHEFDADRNKSVIEVEKSSGLEPSYTMSRKLMRTTIQIVEEKWLMWILTSETKSTYEILSQQQLIWRVFADDDIEDEFEREKQDALNEEVSVMRIGSWEIILF